MELPVDWRWVFYVNLPAAALGVLLGLRLLPDIVRRGTVRPAGFVLAALCTSSALLAATNAPKDDYADPLTHRPEQH